MTLGSREWWERHGEWVVKNKSKLGIRQAAFEKYQQDAMQQPVKIRDDEGQDDWDIVCVSEIKARRRDDFESEEDEDDEITDIKDGESRDDKDDANDNDDDKDKDKKKNITGKLASLYPDHPCITSVRGLDLSRWWILETLKRDPDAFGMYIYNDFFLYGQLEVLENILTHFGDVYRRESPVHKLWAVLEGLAQLVNGGFIDFTMIDDPETAGAAIEMIGCMAVTTIEYFNRQGRTMQELGIPNLGFVSAMIVNWAWGLAQGSASWETRVTWVHRILSRADDLDIRLVGVPRIDEVVAAIRAVQVPQAVMLKWTNVKWATKLATFRRKYGHGTGNSFGTSFDITQMTPAQRRSKSLGSFR